MIDLVLLAVSQKEIIGGLVTALGGLIAILGRSLYLQRRNGAGLKNERVVKSIPSQILAIYEATDPKVVDSIPNLLKEQTTLLKEIVENTRRKPTERNDRG